MGQTPAPRAVKIAVLERNATKFSEQFAHDLEQIGNFKLLDRDLARAAANGANIANEFNLTIDEAKNLGVLIDCNFLLLIKSETVRRSSFQKNVYFESYAIVFVVSAQTGRLISWRDDYFEASTIAASEKLLLFETKNIAAQIAAQILETNETERAARAANSLVNARLIEDLPNETVVAAQNFRDPLPFKRLHPAYTKAAGRRDVEATVDVVAELDEQGAVTHTKIARWAGFELDEAAANTVRKMQFRPALRDGKPLAIRILLRYNFRKLEKE